MDTLAVESHDISIEVIGGGFGESVIICIGKRVLIGLDCCDSLFVSGASNDASILESAVGGLRDDAVINWGLTHYHYDHFQALPVLLDQLGTRLKSFLMPDDYNGADLSDLVRLHAEGESKQAAKGHTAVADYQGLRKRLRSPTYLQKTTIHAVGSMNWLDVTLRTREGVRRRLKVDVFAPSRGLREKILGHVISGMQRDEPIGSSRTYCNLGAYAVTLRYGPFQAVFAADVPTRRSLQERWVREGHAVNLLKVAHHGSPDGTNSELLDCFGTREAQVALVAPFDRHGLPKPEVLELLIRRGYDVRVAARDPFTGNVVHSEEVARKATTEAYAVGGTVLRATSERQHVVRYSVSIA